MSAHTTRRFSPDDLFSLAPTNTDEWTETYTPSFYLNYAARWPELCLSSVGGDGRLAAYILGKAEGEGAEWHGHVSALTVSHSARRQGLARRLMAELEGVSRSPLGGVFVDLFVRASNTLAISLYEGLGYSVHRRVLGYYKSAAGSEDAFDMRRYENFGPVKDGVG